MAILRRQQDNNSSDEVVVTSWTFSIYRFKTAYVRAGAEKISGILGIQSASPVLESGAGRWRTGSLAVTNERVVHYPRLVAKDEESAKDLKKRTLTNLYNAGPAWLDLAHKRLDEAVFGAYGWPGGMGDEELLAKLLELNLARAATQRGIIGGRRLSIGNDVFRQ